MRSRSPSYFLLLLVAIGCSSSRPAPSESTEPVQNENLATLHPGNVHALARLQFSTVQFRRPLSESANPLAGPGGTDYRSHPLPNAKYDCERPAELFARAPVNLRKLRDCLVSMRASVKVLYRLRREPVPLLVLDSQDEMPACLREVAPELPMPREIVFQSAESGSLQCYSARVDVDASQLMGFHVPIIRKLAVRLDLPVSLKDVPSNDASMVDLLTTWVIALFWSENPGEGETLLAKLVPEIICRRCMGEKNMLKATDPPQAPWPPLTPTGP